MELSLLFLVCLLTTTATRTTAMTTVGSIYNNSGCDNTSYYGPTGVISSPNYPGYYYNNLYCDYYIYASTGSSLSFIFKSFNVEYGYDFLTISCPTNSSFPPQQYTGHSLPDPVSIPWCSQGRVNFRSDYVIVSGGFSLDYYVSLGGCGNTVYNDSYGYVTSPNWPNNYGNNQNCSNIIWAPQQSSFHLSFEYFYLQSCCSCDWLEIRCLDNPNYGPYKYCGNYNYYNLYINECTQVLLWFHSDGSDNYQGFNIQYNVYPDPESTSVSSTTGMTTQASQGCGNTSYYGPSGVISSPNYPGLYYDNLYCDYYIYASSSSSSVAIIFEAFNTEQCCDHVNISCPTNSSFPSVAYSGYSLPQPVSIPWCSQAKVNFRTDGSVVSTGFSLDYHISLGGCGDTVFNESQGNVSSPNYPGYYDNYQNCSNIIWAPQRSSFSIYFRYMFLEECCDFVELRCLDNAEYGSQRFTGTTLPPAQYIPRCTQVRVWFYTDGSIVYQGFNLEYYVTPDPATDFTQSSTTRPTTGYVPTDCGDSSYYGPSGVISSPNYPGFYPNNLDCDYNIYTSSSSGSIAIVFQAFKTEQDYDNVTISCPTNLSFPSITYSGSTLPEPFSIPGCSQGRVNFRTDKSVFSTGFSLDYQISLGACGETMYTGSHGNVSSPNYPGDYADNLNCSNIIWASQQSSFSIYFQSMQMEACCDFVELSCLDNAEYGTHRFTGLLLPPTQYIPRCTQVLIWLYTDSSKGFQGFSLEYYVTTESVTTSQGAPTALPSTMPTPPASTV